MAAARRTTIGTPTVHSWGSSPFDYADERYISLTDPAAQTASFQLTREDFHQIPDEIRAQVADP